MKNMNSEEKNEDIRTAMKTLPQLGNGKRTLTKQNMKHVKVAIFLIKIWVRVVIKVLVTFLVMNIVVTKVVMIVKVVVVVILTIWNEGHL